MTFILKKYTVILKRNSIKVKFPLKHQDTKGRILNELVKELLVHPFHEVKCDGVSCSWDEDFKGSPDSSHFIFEINVGKGRIRHRTTPNLNNVVFNWFLVDLEIKFQGRSTSDPTFSDIDFRNKMVWVRSTLNKNRNFQENHIYRLNS